MAFTDEQSMTATEEIVARVWATELRLPRVGLEVDFIDLGSHSLQGLAIVARLEAIFGIAIPIRTLFEEPTVADLAAWIDQRRRQAEASVAEIVRLRHAPGTWPLFALPGGRADAPQLFGLARLARELRPERTVYACPGDPPVPAATPREAWVPAAARSLVAALRQVQPAGPYLLLGVCVGGIYAWEMAHQLEAAGEPVTLLLIDTRNPQLPVADGTFRQAVAQALTPAERRARHRGRRTWRQSRPPVALEAAPDPGEAPAEGRRVVMARAYAPRPFGGRVDLLANREWHRVSPTLGWEGLLGDRLTVAVTERGHGPDWDLPHVASWVAGALNAAASFPLPAPGGSPDASRPGQDRAGLAGPVADFPLSGPETVVAALRQWAARAPDAPAILAADGEGVGAALDYRELATAVDGLASRLRELGVRRTDAVALALPDGPPLAAMLLAAMAAGVALPLAWGMSRDEYARALVGARAVVLPTGAATPARDQAIAAGIPVFELSSGSSGTRPATPFALDGRPIGPPVAEAAPRPDDVAIAIFTSGTTGRPKHIPRTHRNIAATTRAVLASMAISPADRCLNLAPMAFSQGANALFTTIWAGASLVALPGLDLAAVPRWIEALCPTWFSATPTTLRALIANEAAIAALRAARLRMVRASAGALNDGEIEALEATLGTVVLHSYGMSEASFIAGERFGNYHRRHGSVGVPQCDVAVVDAGARFLPQGEAGEIVVRGENVFPGYPDDPEANAAAFLPGGWFRTGDAGWLDGDGYLFLSGRLKEMIKRGGLVIAPLEIEERLLADPAVGEACVFAVPHPVLGEEVAAAVVVKPGAMTTERALRERVSAVLSPQKAPATIAFVAAIPKGPTGKPLRRELAAAMAAIPAASPTPPASAPSAPSGGAATRMAERWARALGREAMHPDDDLLDLGVDSLQVTRLLAELQRAFGLELAPGVLFEQRTPARFATWLDQATAAGAPATVEASVRPLFFLPGTGSGARPLRASRLLAAIGLARPHQDLVVPAVEAGARVAAVAEGCAAAIRQEQPRGPYLLAAVGEQGAIACAVANLLGGAGAAVHLLLIDARAPRQASLGAFTGTATLLASRDWLAEGAALGWATAIGDRLRVVAMEPQRRPRQELLEVARSIRSWLEQVDPPEC